MVVTPALSSISPKWAKDIVYLLAGDNYKKKHTVIVIYHILLKAVKD